LIDALSDSDELVRFCAAQALGYLGDTSAVPALIIALSDSDSGVPLAAAETLGELGDTSAVPALIVALSDSDSAAYLRTVAAEALRYLGDRSAVPALIDALSDSDEIVQLAAAEALGELGDTSAVPALIIALSDSDEDVQLAAAEALGELGDTSAAPALINALSDANKGVRQIAARVLEDLGLRGPAAIELRLSEREATESQYSKLSGAISNGGVGPAFNLELTLSGPAVGGDQRARLADTLPEGGTVVWTMSIRPDAAGEVPATWTVKYDDVNGPDQLETGTGFVEVTQPNSESPPPRPVSIGTIVHGTQIGGDLLESGATKRDDSMNLTKTGTSQPAPPKAFKACPYCGEALNLPKTPKFCPYCAEQLV